MSVSPNKAKTQDSTSQIRVEFREAQTHDILLVRHIHVDELPESFALDTEIDLGLGVWQVERATPERKQDFLASKELVLWMRRLEDDALDAPRTRRATPEHEVLFAPLSQHQLPALEPLPTHDDTSSDLLFLYEEDWLTNQILPVHMQPHIRKEFGHIARTPMGMTHRLDAQHAAPFPFSLDELAECLDAAHFDGLALCQHSSEKRVRDGFAIETAHGTQIYGRLHDHTGQPTITEIALHFWEDEQALLKDLQKLATWLGPLATQYVFVSWESQSLATLSEL
jgi:hypothetical protein